MKWIEIYDLIDKEFKIITIKIINKLERRIDEE